MFWLISIRSINTCQNWRYDESEREKEDLRRHHSHTSVIWCQKMFGDRAMFFYDSLGGTTIGVLFRPTWLTKHAPKLNEFPFTKPTTVRCSGQ
jgi:hypothetical protein